MTDQKILSSQRGDGPYLPHKLLGKGSSEGQLANGLYVEIFKYAPNLEKHMRQAELIISHAGSGSLFEALRMGKPLIAVPNAILMHNHQAELVDPRPHPSLQGKMVCARNEV